MRKNLAIVGMVTSLIAVTLVGCSPAQQPLPNDPSDQEGTPVAASAWNSILNGARLGTSASMYMVKTDGTLIQGPLHSSYSVYGAVNTPDKAKMGFVESTNYVQFYQQGQSAYFQDNGHWTQTTAIQNINPYASFVQLIQAAQARGVKLEQLAKAYVNDEFCDVYRATVPAEIANATPDWLPFHAESTTGDVLYTFYVGQKDHYLRQVSTVSVGGLPNVGSMQANVNTVMFDINQPISKISLPKDLVKQLENSGS